jgi:hypothetical protein
MFVVITSMELLKYIFDNMYIFPITTCDVVIYVTLETMVLMYNLDILNLGTVWTGGR